MISNRHDGMRFNREVCLAAVRRDPVFDIIVIGGGATGLGVALDAASRGFRTCLLEQSDFAKGTSSRSTKLVHGGVRYLAQGDVRLVYEALFERGVLLKNAPHVVKLQPFVIPSYRGWDQLLYGVGLKIYDWMAWRYRFPKTRWLTREEVERLLPGINKTRLRSGVLYYDGQFDDARLAINMAQTAAAHGGILLNYVRVNDLIKDADGKVCGVKASDAETGESFALRAKAVVNATGVFVDNILKMNAVGDAPLVRPSQGVHIVLNQSFLPGGNALMIPGTRDGRVLFAVPWQGHLLAGTTDTPLDSCDLEPVPLEAEVEFILDTLGEYLVSKPRREDVLSIFAGLRPLAAEGNKKGKTKEISRSHKLMTSRSGLVTITGGKWTTYRKMAEDTVNEVIRVARFRHVPCITETLPIHGSEPEKRNGGHLDLYGSDAPLIRALMTDDARLGQPLHKAFPHTGAEVVWAVRHEMARTVEDVLARRLRVLFLDAKAAMAMAPRVAELMAEELRKDKYWQDDQVRAFSALATQYLPHHRDVVSRLTG